MQFNHEQTPAYKLFWESTQINGIAVNDYYSDNKLPMLFRSGEIRYAIELTLREKIGIEGTPM